MAKSSGEQATSFRSAPWPVTRGRVWANAAVDKTTRAKLAHKTRGNSFRNSIDRELPFSSVIFILILLREEGTAQTRGSVAAGSEWFNRQCDCFVTKRHPTPGFELKEVTNLCACGQLERKESPAKAPRRKESTYLALRLCAFAGENFSEFCSLKHKLTVKSRIRATVMAHTTPSNLKSRFVCMT